MFHAHHRASAGLVGGLLLIACLLMHPRLPPQHTQLPVVKSILRFVRDVPYMLAVAAVTTFIASFYFPVFYLQLEAVKQGIKETFAFYILVILNGSSLLGRLSAGPLTSRFGVVNLAILASAAAGVLILCMFVMNAMVFAILAGLFFGVFSALTTSIMAILTHNTEELGLRIGFGFAIVGLGGLVGPPIEGALLTDRFIWWRPMLFAGILMLATTGLLIAVSVMVRHRQVRLSEGPKIDEMSVVSTVAVIN